MSEVRAIDRAKTAARAFTLQFAARGYSIRALRGMSVLLLASAASLPSVADSITVDVFRGDYASVNSFVFSNGVSLTVMDVQRKTTEARKLAELVRSKHLPLTQIFISHGHTDHFTGMALFREEFPNARIVVANEAIKRDIKNYAIYMDSGGQTGGEPALEPALKPKSPSNPGGFDYEHTIQVLPANTLMLDGGGVLEISTDYVPAEAQHMATVYSKDLNALFLADFGYNRVHLWMGDDITLDRVAAWRAELKRLKAKYASLNPTIFPGHGEPTDITLFDSMIRYIDNYTRIVSVATSEAEAMQKIRALYPDYAQAEFFLKYSIENHLRGRTGR